jgi:hypothetical protein
MTVVPPAVAQSMAARPGREVGAAGAGGRRTPAEGENAAWWRRADDERDTNMTVSPATRRSRALRGAAVIGFLLVGLLAAGCGNQQPAAMGSARSCADVSIAAIKHGAAITSLPAVCRGLTRAQLISVANTAVASLAGTMHGKRLMRTRLRDLGPLIPHIARVTAAKPVVPQSGPPGRGGLPLDIVALIAWLITVGLGATMMARWLAHGGLHRGAIARQRALNFVHLALAIAGLAVWIAYVVTGLRALSWAAFGVLILVTGLGMSLLFRSPESAPSPSPAPTPAAATPASPGTAIPASVASALAASVVGSVVLGPAITDGPAAADDSSGRPVRGSSGPLILAAHVGLATTTVLLTLLAAIGAG